jgi:hypothetical protein
MFVFEPHARVPSVTDHLPLTCGPHPTSKQGPAKEVLFHFCRVSHMWMSCFQDPLVQLKQVGFQCRDLDICPSAPGAGTWEAVQLCLFLASGILH